MDFQDKTLTCKDCGAAFTWTAGEQKFYADKGLQNPPGRCKDCRDKSKQAKADRPTFEITCKECGQKGEVPFQPRDPNDVLCAECFAKKRASEKTGSEMPTETAAEPQPLEVPEVAAEAPTEETPPQTTV